MADSKNRPYRLSHINAFQAAVVLFLVCFWFFVLGYWVFQKNFFLFFINEKARGFHMKYRQDHQ